MLPAVRFYKAENMNGHRNIFTHTKYIIGIYIHIVGLNWTTLRTVTRCYTEPKLVRILGLHCRHTWRRVYERLITQALLEASVQHCDATHLIQSVSFHCSVWHLLSWQTCAHRWSLITKLLVGHVTARLIIYATPSIATPTIARV